MKQLKVIAIVVTYNRDNYLKELLTSLLNQKVKPNGFDAKHNLIFNSISYNNVSKGNILYEEGKSKNYNVPLTTSSVNAIRESVNNELMDKKVPVIVRVYRSKMVYNERTKIYEKNIAHHYVLMVGKCNDKYIVSDPGSGSRFCWV